MDGTNSSTSPALSVMAWVWVWTLNGCMGYTCVGQCFSDYSLKTVLLGAEVAGSTGSSVSYLGADPTKVLEQCFP